MARAAASRHGLLLPGDGQLDGLGLDDSVSWAISNRAPSIWKSRSLAGRPGVRASAAMAASLPLPPMPMIVDSSTARRRAASAWQISGNIVQIVVVKTDPGYDTNVGHPGTGTVVAWSC